ncbi:MFS transporter [Bradyrhizobium sp. 2S1]|uniref:MFS transporter n=1 Tax=Bradyrhizobium sp. 2S1 TaxID=1404429 RepID=UPI001CD04FF9|nr:MFS transporter [Bradyrhizobium sp. 2S1]MCK7669024.1 MFS transporter [Bradyrhizobium sp. 2S1]
MATQAISIGDVHQEERASWVPMIAIASGQMIMSFNVASLPVAMGGMVASFGVPPTTVATGIVAYSMLVAGFVMLGAKLAQRFGAVQVFRVAVVLFLISQIAMTFSPTASVMISAQALCGAAGAVIVPSLVALIAENYAGCQQATALGALGSARAAAGVLAFVVGGLLGACLDSRCSNLVGSDSTLGDEQVFSALEHRSDAASAAECAGLRAERPCLAVYG